jgi:hypothetical protein
MWRESVDWMLMAQGSGQWRVQHRSGPSGSIKGGECLDYYLLEDS